MSTIGNSNPAKSKSLELQSAVSGVTYRPIQHDPGNDGFSLDIGRQDDFACFALWEMALSRSEEILEDISANFDVLGIYEIHWSRENYLRNINRLYERNTPDHQFSNWDEKIGAPPFHFIVVRDPNPLYTWKRSVSGKIEPTNERIAEAKHRYRALFEQKYRVHGSNNISEFLVQSTLILGPERLQRTINRYETFYETLHKDLEGADGWKDFDHFFTVLNATSNYVVLRGFDELEMPVDGGDVDLLCDDFQRLASVANVQQNADRPYKGTTIVSEKLISCDIRYVGDGYFPTKWQAEILSRRVLHDNFFAPAPDDLFFSLLYHCKIQKPVVKHKYRAQLDELARSLRFDWFDQDILDEDLASAKLLSGYLRGKNLQYEEPVDRGVYSNRSVLANITEQRSNTGLLNGLHRKLHKAVRHPDRILPYLRLRTSRFLSRR